MRSALSLRLRSWRLQDGETLSTRIIALASLILPGLVKVEAILPTAAIDMYYITPPTGSIPGSREFTTLLASQASFGAYPTMGSGSNPTLFPVLPPQDDSLLCGDHYNPGTTSASASIGKGGSIMLVPRGTCTFQKKARNAQRLGAAAIVIYGTLGSRYDYNTTSSEMIWPADKVDYDCSYGSGYVSVDSLKLNPYNSAVDDPQFTGSAEEGNLCAMAVGADEFEKGEEFERRCPSRRCLLTGKSAGAASGSVNLAETNAERPKIMEACCAWDLHIWLYGERSNETKKEEKDDGPLTIQAYYITMEEAAQMMVMYKEASDAGVMLNVVAYARPRPHYNVSAVLIWALGVMVTGLAAYLSASEYRIKGVGSGDSGSAAIVTGESGGYTELTTRDSDAHAAAPLTGDHENGSNIESATAASKSSHPVRPEQTVRSASQDETLELSWHHAVLFLLFSSAALFILFFFKIYNLVKVMYGIGCSGAISQVIFMPLYTRVARTLCPARNQPEGYKDRILFHFAGEAVTLMDTLSVLSGYAVGISWIVVGFTHHDPQSLPFFWITQNLMGLSMCVVFLGLIRLNSIKVATVLLVAAFFYDIFFVFVTPLIFHSSVMITVATSGGPPTADPTWCEKYPADDGCQGGDPLPMLFTVPRIGDYQGGASLLGLGDVVMPGLLISFACRFDAAKRLVGLGAGGRGVCVDGGAGVATRFLCACLGGYFAPTLIAYGIGLMMANLAVYLMNMGQPALLYLVPMCLGTMCGIGWWKGEMGELWRGPKVLAAADRIVSTHSGHVPVVGGTCIEEQDTTEDGRELN